MESRDSPLSNMESIMIMQLKQEENTRVMEKNYIE